MCFGLQGLLLVGWFAFGIPRVSAFFEGLERHRLHWGPDRGACLEGFKGVEKVSVGFRKSTRCCWVAVFGCDAGEGFFVGLSSRFLFFFV